MSDHRDLALLLRRGELYPSSLLVAVGTVVWALTGAHYFWPIWIMLGLACLLGVTAAVRWGTQPAAHGARAQRTVGAIGVLTSTVLAWIWLITGRGYFWPVWAMLGFAVLSVSVWLARIPATRSLEVRVDELTRTRSGALDVQAAELRRIERDLHDGAQARLVALSMHLGRAEERLSDRPETADLVRRARAEATAAIAELRDLARGISPPVLADRGLEAAVKSLADRAGPQVSVNASLPRRLAPVLETAAYFVVAEALTNAAKHAPNAGIRVTIWAQDDELGVVVADDGLGGADPDGGGLTGLRQRVEALDGWLHVSSPVGEGTTIRAVLPCAG